MTLQQLHFLLVIAAVVMCARPAAAQQAEAVPAAPHQYLLGTNDVIAVTVRQAPELNATSRVGTKGTISLPLIGEVDAANRTADELEETIEERLRAKFIRDPDVTVVVTEVRSHGVTVVGAVQKPGVHQIHHAATLLEVLSMAGGLSADAGDEVIIQRQSSGAIQPPIPIKLSTLLAADPAANIQLQPGDLVNVQGAGVIYVMGAVKKPGAYPIRGNAGLTVLRALAYGEGTTPVAAQRDAVVLRITAEGKRLEIAVDLEKVLKGRGPDVPLEAQDVLFIPVSGGKAATRATLDFLARVVTRGLIP
jgi:polysaccharide biosynthesis/export protein